ncbi:MAG TPA: dipeptidase [Micromonosporaceae bacterium]|nr:dipeptidase [Micromonosporaceae bacterium]
MADGTVVAQDMQIERIRTLLATTPIIDGHNDLPWSVRGRTRYDLSGLDVSTDLTATGLHTDIPRLRAGGVGAQFWSVFVPCTLSGESAVTATLEQIDFVYQLAARYPKDFVVARTADEVEAAYAAGRIASLIGVEGGHSIANSLGALRMLASLGTRYMTLTHSNNTAWADSATDEPAVGGLSAFGQEVVRECNRLGVMADLSHVAPTTMHAALDVSTAPAFFSHSSARAVTDHPRNVPDDVLTRVRDTNGVVMVTFVSGFVNAACHEWMDTLLVFQRGMADEHDDDGTSAREAIEAYVAEHPRPACSVTDVADHVEHVRDVAGVDAVGLGSDFDGFTGPPDGLADVSAYPNLLAELADRGWSDDDLGKLTWRNAVRVLRDTEAAARAAQVTRGPSLATLDQAPAEV